MKLTRIDLNSWLLQIADKTILIDPWLIDPLIFYGQPWLFTAYHNTPPIFTPDTLPKIDLILLSQGVDDHCHQPTLAQLDRQIPVVGSATAATVVKKLGYLDVISLTPWESYTVVDLEITAVPSVILQPGQIENGYVLKDKIKGETLYYEPHIFPVEAGIEKRFHSIDVALAPVTGQVFPLLGQVIMGPEEAITLAKTLRPRFFIPNGLGDIKTSGILPKLIRSVGSVEQFSQQLATSGLSTLLLPSPGESLELS